MWNVRRWRVKTLTNALLVFLALLLIFTLMVWGFGEGAHLLSMHGASVEAQLPTRAIPSSDISMEDVFYLTLLVAVEAEGESQLGKLAVAWVAVNRSRLLKQPLTEILFDPEEFTGFWVTRKVDKRVFRSAYAAASAAYFETVPDPTKGATHYLNVALTKKQLGKLPSWYNPKYITVVIGNHTFLKLY